MCTTSTTMAVKLKKVTSKLLAEEENHVSNWSGDHVVRHVVWGKGLKPFWHVRTWAYKPHWHASTLTWKACWHVRHVSIQGTLACEYESTQSTLAREHVNMQDTLAHERVSTQDTANNLKRFIIYFTLTSS